jgi:small-conductance mechanosensitive channel
MIRRLHGLVVRCLPLVGCVLLPALPLAAQESLAGDFSSQPEIQKRLAAAREEHSQSAGDQKEVLQELVSACQYHLAAVDLVATANAERSKARQALENWRGFSENPPYPIRFIDDLRENRAVLDSYQSAVDAQIRIVNRQLESARDQLDAHQRAERGLEDKLSAITAPEALKQAQDALSRERIGSRIVAEEIGRLGLHLETQRAEQQMIQYKIQLAGLQLKAVEGKSSFTPDELDEILRGIREERRAVVHESQGSARPSAALNPLISWHVEFLDLQKQFWQARFDALKTQDPAVRKSGIASFKQWQDHIHEWADIMQLRLDGGTPPASVVLDPAELRDALRQARGFQRRIGFAITELGGGDQGIPRSFFDGLKSRLLSVWQAELYLAEEDDIIDGRKVVTYRAVTVGKIIRLAVIIAVGWLLLRFVARRLQPVVSRRPGVTQGAARLITRLFFGTGIALLVIYGFNTVHIPFTVFAFMGGALAIGVGFGTQTMLKNLISGIILVFERPFKVGDIVEVAGINGRVQNIGLRASRIEHFDGIDSLVPNSYLLENSLTNWSFSNTILRHNITVGVAYGSDTRQVAHLLLATAAEHGLVLDKPAPEVRFSDFGDNSLVFMLFFWFDSDRVGRDTLASDLRHMIGKTLTEAGIVISFPQRDVHFDRETPLRVELSRSPRSEP